MALEHKKSPIANLLSLPPEIKDQIYSNLFHASYRAVPTSESRKDPRSPFTLADFAVLRVSKQVYHEAAGVLFSRSVFKFDNLEGYSCKSLSVNVDHVLNAEFLIHVAHEPRFKHSHEDLELLRIMAGVRILRKELHIRLENCTSSMIKMPSTLYFDPLKTLVGFSIVVIELQSAHNAWPVSTTANRSSGDNVRRWTLSPCETLIPHLERLLGPALGPAWIGDVENVEPGVVCSLEFRPREYMDGVSRDWCGGEGRFY